MRSRIAETTLAGALLALAAGSLMAGDDRSRDERGRVKSRFSVSADLIGYQEVPALSATAQGRFQTIYWRLRYSDLEGDLTQAHVHFGQMGVNGLITADLVVGAGRVTTPAPVPGQGIEPGAFAEIAAAIRARVAYANVHTSKRPGGEIRGQLH